MKKYKALKDMPGWKKGAIHTTDEICVGVNIFKTAHYDFNFLIKEGWIEEVKEEDPLVRKFRDFYDNLPGDYYKDLANIARAYFREHPEEIFPKVIKVLKINLN